METQTFSRPANQISQDDGVVFTDDHQSPLAFTLDIINNTPTVPVNDPLSLSVCLAMIKEEHRQIEAEIYQFMKQPAPDQLALQRLKKRKLRVKEEMDQVESMILPDIIA